MFDPTGLALADRAPLTRTFLAAARERAQEALASGHGGLAVCRGMSDALDEVARALFAAAVRDLPAGVTGKVSLVATGGWGRRETCPHSDLDLLFLVADFEEDAARALAERVLYPLWDAGLEVGHAVRALPDAVSLARKDLATMTALLDARLVAGDHALADCLPRELKRALGGESEINAFVRALMSERRARHARFGDTPFLLEPNLKHGRGALRDLALALWAARVRFGVADFPGLEALGEASSRQVASLVTARDFVLRLRAAAHLAAGRRQDQLTFELQEALAPRLYPDARVRPGEARPAVAPAVEELMRQYYLHARDVAREAERLLERAVFAPRREPVTCRLNESFIAWNGQAAVKDGRIFRERPAEAVRLFNVALAHGLPIYGHTRDLVAEAVAADAGRLAADPEARRQLMALLCDPRDARQPSLLEQAHELGVLTAIIPELGPCTGRVQHDLYHVLTVDQHQLAAVALLKRLARGELARPAAAATQAARRVPAALFLATLLHDVGKPLGKGHAEKGARLAAQVARRLGLDAAATARTELLVRNHLLLSHLSQRRDLHDTSLVASLAGKVGDEETLTELYLLTYCDTAATAPGNLTEWKDRLLRELFERTRAYLRKGPDLAGTDRSAQVKRRRRRVVELLGGGAEAERWLAGVPDRYVASLPPRAIVRHARLSRAHAAGAGEQPVAMSVSQHPARGVSALAVVAADRPGLLARIAGVLAANRISVAGALIASRSPTEPGEAGEALDTFLVRDRYGRAVPSGDPRWERVQADLGRVLAGAQDVEELLAARTQRGGLPQRVTPAVPTEIEIDNEVAEDFTVIDVFTQDRIGVLYAVTRALTDLGLDIFLSKVATEAERVADVFYVRDRQDGGKLTDPSRLALVEETLRRALARVAGEMVG